MIGLDAAVLAVTLAVMTLHQDRPIPCHAQGWQSQGQVWVQQVKADPPMFNADPPIICPLIFGVTLWRVR